MPRHSAHAGTPYLEVVDEPRQMRGEGAPRSTVFGVLGRTREGSSKMKSLGGLVHRAPTTKIPKGELISHPKLVTERHIVGPAAKTHIPGAHYAQVPYAGVYMSAKGSEL